MTFPVGQLPPDVLKALASGRTIDAIKRLNLDDIIDWERVGGRLDHAD